LSGAGHPSPSGASSALTAGPRGNFLDVWVLSVPDVRLDRVDLSVLDEGERQRAARFVHDDDRRSYLSAHLALRLVLGRCLNIAPRALTFAREACPLCDEPHGRPTLGGADPAVQFSLSHSGDLVLLGIAGTPVGVDVEAVPDEQAVTDLSGRLHPAEQSEIAAAEQPRLAFARVWTRKEAYLKGIGTGLPRGLAVDYLGGTGLAPLPAGWSVLDVPVPAGYAAAVAVLGAASVTRVRELEPEALEAG
jgi:4'-phosphopantetheinyl transferase